MFDNITGVNLDFENEDMFNNLQNSSDIDNTSTLGNTTIRHGQVQMNTEDEEEFLDIKTTISTIGRNYVVFDDICTSFFKNFHHGSLRERGRIFKV